MPSPRSTVAALLLAGALAAQEPALVQASLGDGLKLDAAQWGEAAVVDGHACRRLAGAGVVPLAAWWGDGLRPPAGASYRLEVEYQDTAATPVRIEAFAGLPGRRELHRIGGRADGAWKTALVPLPWDFVMRLPGTDRTELVFAVSGPTPVPIASLRIVAGDPAADEARWDAETREWVARGQAEARAKATPPDAEHAALPDALAATRLVPFTRHVLRPIQRSSAPQAGETGVALRLTLARNELESGQFGVYANGAALAGVTVALPADGFRRDDGQRLDARCALLAAEYAATGGGDHPRLLPERLWPAYPVDVPAGAAHLFLLELDATRAPAQPGTYRGALRVAAAEGASAELPVEIVVAPVELIDLDQAGLTMGGCTAGLLPAHELAELRRQNHNSIQLWYSGVAPDIVRVSPTSFTLDFTVLDEFMREAKAAGITSFVWFLGGDPYSFPDTLHLERELYRQVYSDKPWMEGRKEYLRKASATPDELLPEIRDLYVEWTRQVMAHARAAGWPEPILTPFDEPAKFTQRQNAAPSVYWKDADGRDHIDHPRREAIAQLKDRLDREGIVYEDLGTGGAGTWIKPHFQQSCALLHQGDPALRVYASIHHGHNGLPFLGDVEVFCTNAIHENPALGDIVRAAPKPTAFWQYAGAGDPLGTRATYGVRYARFDSRGSLCWAYDFAGDRWDTTRGDSWIYAWTTPYGVARSPTYEGMREAWDDRRYLETLRAAGRAAGPERAAEVEAELGAWLAAIMPDPADDGAPGRVDPAALDDLRARIVARLGTLAPR